VQAGANGEGAAARSRPTDLSRIGRGGHAGGSGVVPPTNSHASLVFEQQNRRIYNDVPRLLPEYGNLPIGTAPGERINVMVRVSGL
jgi:hypothetical protein